jgi:hypothetical protein
MGGGEEKVAPLCVIIENIGLNLTFVGVIVLISGENETRKREASTYQVCDNCKPMILLGVGGYYHIYIYTGASPRP